MTNINNTEHGRTQADTQEYGETREYAVSAIPKKPTWMKTEHWSKFLATNDPVCVMCGSTERLSVDHILAQTKGGEDITSNYQFLCINCNSSKSNRPDKYWSGKHYWDTKPNLDNFRGSQLKLFSKIIGLADHFSRGFSQINNVLYTNAWVVGSGKTLGVPVLGWALNFAIMSKFGTSAPRVDGILVLTKEAAIKRQIISDLKIKVTRYGLANTAPNVVDLDSWAKVASIAPGSFDVAVACVQLFFDENGKFSHDFERQLSKFPVIVFDEEHFAKDQVAKILACAHNSLCVGMTSTPFDAAFRFYDHAVLLTKWTYQDATANDGSLKFVPKDISNIFEEITVETADLLKCGEEVINQKNATDDPDYQINYAPAKAVAERTVMWLWESDRIVEQRRAPHRPENHIADYKYPAHAMITVSSYSIGVAVTDQLNAMFNNNRAKFPESEGWRAEFCYSSRKDNKGKMQRGKELSDEHPWMQLETHGVLGSRVLVVIDIGREGVSNPYCQAIGLAKSTDSIVEAVQRELGRSTRSVKYLDAGGVTHVPTSSLDMPKIISHVAFNNRDVIQNAVDYILDMDEKLKSMPTVEALIEGADIAEVEAKTESKLSVFEKLQIAAEFGSATLEGRDFNQDVTERIVRNPDGTYNRDKAEKADKWHSTLEGDARYGTENAIKELRIVSSIEPVTVVVRDVLDATPTEDDLRRFLESAYPDLAPKYEINPDGSRDFVVEMYRSHAREFNVGVIPSYTDLETIRRSLAYSIFEVMIGFFDPYRSGENEKAKGELRGCVHGFVGSAVKHLLGITGDEGATKDSKWETPAVHHVLERKEVQQTIKGYVRSKLLRTGKFSALSAGLSFKPEDQNVQ